MIELYKKFNNNLGDTYSQFITGHEKLANGVYKTTYENGKSVIVNYNYADYDYKFLRETLSQQEVENK